MALTRNPSLDALTGLRFFAAMHVVLHHYLPTVPAYRATAPEWLHRLMAAGPAAVGLFFVLSGFILTYNYVGRDSTLKVPVKQFWAARFARIYPIYLVGLLVYLPIAVARYLSGTGLSVVEVGAGAAFVMSGILTLFLLQSWSLFFTAWNGPSWSLSAEAFFYAIFPWCGPRFMSWNRRKLLLTLSALWLLSLAGPAYFLLEVLGHSSKQTKEMWEVTLVIQPLLRSIPFLIGAGAGVLFLRKNNQPASAGILLNTTALIILVAFVSVPRQDEVLLENCLTPLFALLLYLLACDRGWLCKLLAHPALVLLGEASYAIYILHNPLWNYLARLQNMLSYLLRGHFPSGLAKPGVTTEWNYDMSGWMFCVYLILLVGSSIVALRYIEQPARTFLRDYFSKRPTQVQVPVSSL